MSWTRSATAGAAAATVWGLQEPLDRAIFRSGYSDIALLGKLATRGRGWRPLGFALHGANGALFGLAYEAARRRTDRDPRRLAVAMALTEHAALYPLAHLTDRHHPARGGPDVPVVARSPRAFLQGAWRHLLFGWLLGRLAV